MASAPADSSPTSSAYQGSSPLGSVDLVLPCLNEAEALPWVLARVPAGVQAIVVDNGSTDGSADLAAALGADVVACRDRGYGAACHAGLLAATASIVAFCDCDASIDPSVVRSMAQLVADGTADLVVSHRRPTRASAWPLHARLANRALAWRVRRMAGGELRDIGPVRVARRAELLELGIADRRSGYPLETVLRAASAGWRLAAQDVAYTPRLGRSKVTGTVGGTLRAVHDMRAVLAQCSTP